MNTFPKIERGFYHLTHRGWRRVDAQPFPDERLETWAYEMEWPAEDAKEQISLTRTWVRSDMTPRACAALHACFGEPVLPTPDRNVTMECYV